MQQKLLKETVYQFTIPRQTNNKECKATQQQNRGLFTLHNIAPIDEVGLFLITS